MGLEFKNITTKEELIKWAKAVNECTDIQVKCALQDVFGHSNYRLLKKSYLEACECGESALVTFAIYKNQSEDIFFDFLNEYSGHKAEQVILQSEERVSAREAILREGKRAIYKRIRKATDRITFLERELVSVEKRAIIAETAARGERRRAEECAEEAGKFRQMQTLMGIREGIAA